MSRCPLVALWIDFSLRSRSSIAVKGDCESMMKRLSSGGSCIGGRRRDSGGYIPREGASAGLNLLPTYTVWKEDPTALTRENSWSLLNTSLIGLLRLLPFHQPSTTPCYDFFPMPTILGHPHFFLTNPWCHYDIIMTSSPMTSLLLHYDLISLHS